ELTELGLGEVLARTGIATNELSYFNKFGQLIYTEKRGLAANGRNTRSIADNCSCYCCRPFASASAMRIFAVDCGSWRLRRIDTVSPPAFFDSRSGTVVLDEADVLVGADGIHSAVRRQLHPKEGEPCFAQQLLWHAAIDAEPFLGGRTMIIAGHFHQRAIVYPIGPADKPGRLLTNWVCQMAVSDDAPPREDW